jgi:hypothetical protein
MIELRHGVAHEALRLAGERLRLRRGEVAVGMVVVLRGLLLCGLGLRLQLLGLLAEGRVAAGAGRGPEVGREQPRCDGCPDRGLDPANDDAVMVTDIGCCHRSPHLRREELRARGRFDPAGDLAVDVMLVAGLAVSADR